MPNMKERVRVINKRDFNSGVLFATDYSHEKVRDTDPPMRGKLFIGEREHWFDGWNSEDRTQIDLEFRPKDTRGDNKGKGSVKKTDKTDKKENYPDWKGQLKTANGDEYWVSAWRHEPSGKAQWPFLSFAIEPKEERRQQEAKPETEQTTGQPDFPF